MLAEKQKQYQKEWYKNNKDKKLEYSREWQRKNPAKVKAAVNKHRYKEGYCVYKATYPEGEYIGQGLTVTRRQQHLSGNSTIAKRLCSKAIEFEVLFSSDSKIDVLVKEHELLNSIGIDKLLNKNFI